MNGMGGSCQVSELDGFKSRCVEMGTGNQATDDNTVASDCLNLIPKIFLSMQEQITHGDSSDVNSLVYNSKALLIELPYLKHHATSDMVHLWTLLV